VPVLELEEKGVNFIPYALAEALAKHGLSLELTIRQLSGIKRKSLKGAERILPRKVFAGPVEPGRLYLLVDDVLTQGGTIHELRHHIVNNGGEAVAGSSLAFARWSNIIAIEATTVKNITERFGRAQVENILQEFNIAGRVEALTQSEGRYILGYKSLESLRAGLTRGRDSLRDKDDRARFSRDSHRETLTTSTPQSVLAELYQALGKSTVARMIRRGRLKIFATQEELQQIIATNGVTAGLTPGDTIYLVANGIDGGNAINVLDHELGVHLRNLLMRAADFAALNLRPPRKKAVPSFASTPGPGRISSVWNWPR
jgi:hypothetical protein